MYVYISDISYIYTYTHTVLYYKPHKWERGKEKLSLMGRGRTVRQE